MSAITSFYTMQRMDAERIMTSMINYSLQSTLTFHILSLATPSQRDHWGGGGGGRTTMPKGFIAIICYLSRSVCTYTW